MSERLQVYLSALPVGAIDVSDDGHCRFTFHRSYRENPRRPVLGQHFEDNLDRSFSTHTSVPPFFANLLPERDSMLRRLIADKLAVHQERESFLLSYLGEDLTGAVRVLPDDGEPNDNEYSDSAGWTNGGDANGRQLALGNHEPSLRFSLAGLQLKFSMLNRGHRLTLPARGEFGDWIVKLPYMERLRVPERELATMNWARASGIAVPPCKLVPVATLSGLPTQVPTSLADKHAFAIERFDRTTEGGRVHQEDFAQVFNLDPRQKYQQYNYESIASVILHSAGRAALDDFLRRFVFVVLSGNADAHHKNWSLRYPDGIQATLAPAYDQISTILYPDVDRQLALNFARSKSFERVSLSGFRRLARKLKGTSPASIGEDEICAHIAQAGQRIADAWSAGWRDFGYDEADRALIEQHWATLELVHEIGILRR